MKIVLSFIKKLFKQHRSMQLIALMLLFVTLLVGITLYRQHKKSFEDLQYHRSEMILQKVNAIQSEIEYLSRNANQNQQLRSLERIEKDMGNAQHSLIDLAKTSDIQKVYSQLESIKEVINIKMTDIKHWVSTEKEHKHYLPPSHLPFHLTAIDMIGGEPYVTVDDDNHTFPMSIGDTLTGWRLIAADFESGFAEFMNANKQYVKITL